MAVSAWIPLPPTVDDEGVTYPADGSLVWVRFRAWTRRPFKAIWRNGAGVTDVQNATATNDAGDELRFFTVPWYELDAWKPIV